MLHPCAYEPSSHCINKNSSKQIESIMRTCMTSQWQTKRRIYIFLFAVTLAFPLIVVGQTNLRITATGKTPLGFARVFSKKIDVFDLSVFATRSTPDSKLLHAANVLAQYLDNDANGIADNKLVLKSLQKERGAIVMFGSQREAKGIDIHRYIPEQVWDQMILVALFGDETLPNGVANRRFDATYEEVLHLITSGGYAYAYPRIFGETAGTTIAKAMDNARGGHFIRPPRSYPQTAWYTYHDRSCDYQCQITEYIYWGITSKIGAQDFPGRFEQISEEWRLNTPAKLKSGDPVLYALLSDPQYSFPTKLPDGNYRPRWKNTNTRSGLPAPR